MSCKDCEKSSPKTEPDFPPQPMETGELKEQKKKEVLDIPHSDKPDSQKTSACMHCEHCGQKSAPKTKPSPQVFISIGVGQPMASGGMRLPQDLKVDDEPHCKRPTSQVSRMTDPSYSNTSMQSITPAIPRTGAMTRFYPDTGDGVQRLQRVVTRNGKFVGSEEFEIYSTD